MHHACLPLLLAQALFEYIVLFLTFYINWGWTSLVHFLYPLERLWSRREAISTRNITLTALPRLQYFRCLLNRRGVQAAPVTNFYARRPPTGPGSCYEQWSHVSYVDIVDAFHFILFMLCIMDVLLQMRPVSSLLCYKLIVWILKFIDVYVRVWVVVWN